MTTQDQIQQLEKRLDKRFKEMQQEIDMRLAPLHDYMIGQQAINDNNRPQSASAVNSRDLMVFIIKLLGGVAGILAAAAWISKTK